MPHSQRSNQRALPRGCRCTHLRDADLQHGRVGSGAWLVPEPKEPSPGHEAELTRRGVQGRRVRGRCSGAPGRTPSKPNTGSRRPQWARPEADHREVTRTRKYCIGQSREGQGVSDATFPTWRPIGACEGGPGKSLRPMADCMRRWGGEDGCCSPNPKLRWWLGSEFSGRRL